MIFIKIKPILYEFRFYHFKIVSVKLVLGSKGCPRFTGLKRQIRRKKLKIFFSFLNNF